MSDVYEVYVNVRIGFGEKNPIFPLIFLTRMSLIYTVNIISFLVKFFFHMIISECQDLVNNFTRKSLYYILKQRPKKEIAGKFEFFEEHFRNVTKCLEHEQNSVTKLFKRSKVTFGNVGTRTFNISKNFDAFKSNFILLWQLNTTNNFLFGNPLESHSEIEIFGKVKFTRLFEFFLTQLNKLRCNVRRPLQTKSYSRHVASIRSLSKSILTRWRIFWEELVGK